MKKSILIIMFSLALIVLGSNIRPDSAEAGPITIFGVEKAESCWAVRLTGVGPGITWEYVAGTRTICTGWGGFCWDMGFCHANLPV